MMEVVVDAAPGLSAPQETFISLRIGDVQKQSRFSNSRTYKFPDPGDGKGQFGRVEIFQRVGHMTVNFENEGTFQDVTVPCLFANGQTNLGLRVAAKGVKQLDPIGAEKKKHAKVRLDAAQAYLEEHKLEDLLAGAMREVIKNKPNDPHSFLSNFITNRGGEASSGAGFLPPIANAKKAPNLPAPVEKSAKEAPVAAERAPKASKAEPPQARPTSRSGKLPPINNAKSAAPAAKPAVALSGPAFGKYYTAQFLEAPADGFLSMYKRFAKYRPATVGKAEQDSLRQMAKELIGKAALDGSLVKALASTSSPDDMRQKASKILASAALDGSLLKALVSLKEVVPTSYQMPSVGTWLIPRRVSAESAKADSRQQMSAILVGAASDGSLLRALESVSSEGGVRQKASQMLTSAALDGSLMKALARISSPDGVRQTASLMLTSAALDGSLMKALARISSPDGVRQAASQMLTSAALDGSLLTELTRISSAPKAPAFLKLPSVGTWLEVRLTEAEAEAGPVGTVTAACQRKAGLNAFQFQPSVGSWLAPLKGPKDASAGNFDGLQFRMKPSVGSWLTKIPPQVERPWYYKDQGYSGEEGVVVHKMMDVIAEKDKELANLKAQLKALGVEVPDSPSASNQPSRSSSPTKASSPAKAKAPAVMKVVSEKGFTPYYDAFISKNIEMAGMSKLYCKFNNKFMPKAVTKVVNEKGSVEPYYCANIIKGVSMSSMSALYGKFPSKSLAGKVAPPVRAAVKSEPPAKLSAPKAVSKVVTEKGFVPYYTANVIPGVSFDSMAKVYSKFNNRFVAKVKAIPVVGEKGFVPYYTANVIPGVSFDSMAKVYSKFNNRFVAKATLRCTPVTDMAKLYSKFNDKFIAKVQVKAIPVVGEKGFVPYYTANVIPGVSFDSMAKVYSKFNNRFVAKATLRCIPVTDMAKLYSKFNDKFIAKGGNARAAACAVLQQASASGLLSAQLNKVFAKDIARGAACAVLQQANASGILSSELSKICGVKAAGFAFQPSVGSWLQSTVAQRKAKAAQDPVRDAACSVLQQANSNGLLSAQLSKVFAKDIARGAACAVLQQANASGILSSELSKVFAKAAPGSQGEKYAFQPSVGSWLQCTPAQRRKHTPKEKARDAACAVLQQANASGILSAELSKIFVQVMPDILDKSPRTLMEVDSKTLIDSFRSEIAKRDAEIAALKASM